MNKTELITQIDKIGSRLCAISIFSPEWDKLVKRRKELTNQLKQFSKTK